MVILQEQSRGVVLLPFCHVSSVKGVCSSVRGVFPGFARIQLETVIFPESCILISCFYDTCYREAYGIHNVKMERGWMLASSMGKKKGSKY